MDSQILLNVNFCSEVHTNLIEKNEKSVYVRAGYSLGGLRIVPQENAGICVICMDGHIKRVYPGELEAAVCIEGELQLHICGAGSWIWQGDSGYPRYASA